MIYDSLFVSNLPAKTVDWVFCISSKLAIKRSWFFSSILHPHLLHSFYLHLLIAAVRVVEYKQLELIPSITSYSHIRMIFLWFLVMHPLCFYNHGWSQQANVILLFLMNQRLHVDSLDIFWTMFLPSKNHVIVNHRIIFYELFSKWLNNHKLMNIIINFLQLKSYTFVGLWNEISKMKLTFSVQLFCL